MGTKLKFYLILEKNHISEHGIEKKGKYLHNPHDGSSCAALEEKWSKEVRFAAISKRKWGISG